MRILGIETSCDETGAAVILAEKETSSVTILSNVISSSMALHSKTGGIIPEIAAREQIKYIIPVIDTALKAADCIPTHVISSGRKTMRDPDEISPALSAVRNDSEAPSIDAIAVTYGPGLIGSLLVGVETAKTLSLIWKKPLISVNHLYGHIYANFVREISNIKYQISNPTEGVEFPALALIVSGGHTDLVLLKKHSNIQWISGTRDDAAGEAFDKIGRLLGLSYPAGPQIEQLAKKGNPNAFIFPRPLLHENTFDFSFSGLKTAVLREVERQTKGKALSVPLPLEIIADICLATQDAIIDVLIKKTLRAAEKYQVKSILLGGGVAANQTLRNQFLVHSSASSVRLFAPAKSLCTDNAAMIAAAAFFNYKKSNWVTLTPNPELYFD